MEVATGLLVGILFLLICLFLTVFAFAVYCGIFVDIVVGTAPPPFKELTIAYKFARGPYKNASKLYTEVSNLTPNLVPVGIYYDPPHEVPPEELRYVVGAVLSEDKEAPVKETEMQILTSNGFKIITLPSVSHAVQTSFPHKNIFSVIISIIRVYPKLNQYIQERSLCAYPMIEVYYADRILFLAPLSRQDEFSVEETQLEDEDESLVSDSVDDSTYDYTGTDGECDRSPRAGSSLASQSWEKVSAPCTISQENKTQHSSSDEHNSSSDEALPDLPADSNVQQATAPQQETIPVKVHLPHDDEITQQSVVETETTPKDSELTKATPDTDEPKTTPEAVHQEKETSVEKEVKDDTPEKVDAGGDHIVDAAANGQASDHDTNSQSSTEGRKLKEVKDGGDTSSFEELDYEPES
jgi:hypothetical protein